MKTYGIGGLGVDERIFSELDIGFELTPLKWLAPQSGESLRNYVARFAKQIDQSCPFSIVGVSFGGIIAIELSKIMDPKKIILISSASTSDDIPQLFKLAGKSGLLNIMPGFFMKPPMFLANFFFSVSDPNHKQILKEILADTDVQFIRWAVKSITTWKNTKRPTNVIRIHGSSDRLLSFTKNEKIIVLHDAGHFMIVDRAKELSEVLNKVLDV